MLKSVYALVGPDLFLQLEHLRELTEQFAGNIQRRDFDGDEAELGEVLDELRSYSMFGGWKMVVLREADDFVKRFREKLESYLESPAANSTLVLRLSSLPANQRIYRLIRSHGQILDCRAPQDVVSWAIRRAARQYRMELEESAAEVLVDCVGGDLGRLDSELAKLSLMAGGSADQAAVLQAVAFQREQEMWDMTDALAAGKISEALVRWRQLVQMDSSAEYRATAWLTAWLEKVRRALHLKNQGKSDWAIGKELNIWPAERREAFVRTAVRLGEHKVRRLVMLLAELDYRAKTGLGDLARNVERFILSVQ